MLSLVVTFVMIALRDLRIEFGGLGSGYRPGQI